MTRAIGVPVLLALVITAASCGSGRTTAATQPPEATSTSATQTSANPLVGTWERVNDCDMFVRTMKKAGLIDLAPKWLVGGGYFTNVNQIDRADLCKGANEVKHSHFFTDSGMFGSYDETGTQVDDGDYKILGPGTLTFPSHEQDFGYDIAVHYRVEGDALTFAVVVPHPCTGNCPVATAWAISAFYPTPFHRLG
jgi:hypothetical protein